MKTWLSMFAFLAFSAAVLGQSDSLRPRKYRHEFGADMVGFVRYLTYKGDGLGQFYAQVPTYYLTYRLKFGHGGLRAGIGGAYSNGNTDDYGQMLPVKLKEIEKQFDLRLGWESTSGVARKFEAYYGIDLMGGLYKNRDDNWYANGGYINGSRHTRNRAGAAAFFGMRFVANERVSFNSDFGYGFFFQKETEVKTFVSEAPMYPPMADEPRPVLFKNFTEFRPPYMLNINIAF